jgi:VWFA-related protein
MRRACIWPAAGILAAGVTIALDARPQQPPPAFHGGVDLVEIDAVVLDSHRQPVTGLSAQDFVVTDDGTPRPIVAFTPVTLPSETSAAPAPTWARDVVGDVATNARTEEGRLVVIMMDRSIPAGPATLTARAIATAAVDALGPEDLAAVVHSSGFANEGVSQDFTADKARLRTAIAAPMTGLVAPPSMSSDGLQNAPPEMIRTGDCVCGLCVLDAITNVADALAGAEQRHKMVLFLASDIVIQGGLSSDSCGGLLREARERAMRALDRANVTVHAVDPSGLETLSKDASSFRTGDRQTPAMLLRRQGNLGVLPDYTGGRLVANTNTPAEIVPAIFEESQSYYLLAIERGVTHDRDPRRNIRVRVNRRGLTVRARTAYYAEPANASPTSSTAPSTNAADRAMTGLLPDTGLLLALSLTPRILAGGRTDVLATVRIDRGRASTSTATRERPTGFDVSIGVFDGRARPVGQSRQSLALATPESDGGATIETHDVLSLAPGRYEVRAGVATNDGVRTGSVYGYVDVPAPTDHDLLVSGVTFALQPAAPMQNSPAQANGDSLAGVTAQRAFHSTDRVIASANIWQRARTLGPLAVHIRMLDADNHVVVDDARHIESSAFEAGVAPVRVDLPLATLPDGAYLLAIDASDNAHTATQRVEIEMRH